LLRVRLKHLNELNDERKCLCEKYLGQINNPLIELPLITQGAETVWHQFVIKIKYRAEFVEYLNAKQIGSIIHYPIPPHLSEAYAYLGFSEGDFPITELYADTVLSLPLYNGMTDEEIDYVIEIINNYSEVNENEHN